MIHKVLSKGWPTWNFSERQWGPIVPPGKYQVKRLEMPTGRMAIVLAYPEDIGVNPGDLIGEDEEHLRDQIDQGRKAQSDQGKESRPILELII